MGVSRQEGKGEEVFLRKRNHQFVVLEIIWKVNVSHARTRFPYPSRTISKIADGHPFVFIRSVTFLLSPGARSKQMDAITVSQDL